jgi:aminoglycoside 6'-N-acetyltransferase I
MRQALWPSEPGEHAHEIARYFDLGGTPQLLEVLLAYGEKDEAVGMVELSIRPYAEGCVSDRVAFVEGWYVEPAERLKGIGAALIRAGEDWARSQGCVELGSDAEVENLESAAAHRALGFTETGVVRCFRKEL